MRHLFSILSASLLLAPAVALATGPVVTTAAGNLQGVGSVGVESFKGIPFAAPPVGALRWRAPQPAPGWNGIRQADAFASDCMQQPFAGDDAPRTTKPAEDCLYLNVW